MASIPPFDSYRYVQPSALQPIGTLAVNALNRLDAPSLEETQAPDYFQTPAIQPAESLLESQPLTPAIDSEPRNQIGDLLLDQLRTQRLAEPLTVPLTEPLLEPITPLYETEQSSPLLGGGFEGDGGFGGIDASAFDIANQPSDNIDPSTFYSPLIDQYRTTSSFAYSPTNSLNLLV